MSLPIWTLLLVASVLTSGTSSGFDVPNGAPKVCSEGLTAAQNRVVCDFAAVGSNWAKQGTPISNEISKLLWELVEEDVKYDCLCGVPYTALPIATLISVYHNIPMLIRRKETKQYGTKKLIEGKFNRGDKCIIVEDVVTSGSSILETFKDLEGEGLHVTDAIVVVDREQGGNQNLQQQGLKMKSLVTLTKIMEILYDAGKVDHETVDNVRRYLSASQIKPDGTFINNVQPKETDRNARLKLPFSERVKFAKNPIGRRLLTLMDEKKTTLCVAADVTTSSELLSIAKNVGPFICLLKTHMDILVDFSEDVIAQLLHLAEKDNFLILEDRKFADIGHLVGLQYSHGIYHIATWAHLVTVHPVSGEGVLAGLKGTLKTVSNIERGCFLVAEMSTEGHLATPDYIAKTVKMSQTQSDFVAGLVCQTPNVITSPGLIQLTPGIRLESCKDQLGQQWNSPESAVLSRGADVAVVGRGIVRADDQAKAASDYRDQLWSSYEKRIQLS